MKKKDYLQPQMSVVHVSTSSVLATSTEPLVEEPWSNVRNNADFDEAFDIEFDWEK